MMDIEEKKKIVFDFCIDFIEHNGYVRLGYAVDNTIKSNENFAFKKSVSSLLVKTGKYYREVNPSNTDYDIYQNPNYKLPKWHEEHYNLSQIRNGAITAGFALIVGIALWLIQNQEKVREYKDLHQQLDKANAKIDSLISLPIFRK